MSKYSADDIVWLIKWEDQPRQLCRIIADEENGMYMGEVIPTEKGDDGLREFSEDQIEGLAEKGTIWPG